jgi:hypothetical protein
MTLARVTVSTMPRNCLTTSTTCRTNVLAFVQHFLDVVGQFLGIVEMVTLASVTDNGCGNAGAYGKGRLEGSKTTRVRIFWALLGIV